MSLIIIRVIRRHEDLEIFAVGLRKNVRHSLYKYVYIFPLLRGNGLRIKIHRESCYIYDFKHPVMWFREERGGRQEKEELLGEASQAVREREAGKRRVFFDCALLLGSTMVEEKEGSGSAELMATRLFVCLFDRERKKSQTTSIPAHRWGGSERGIQVGLWKMAVPAFPKNKKIRARLKPRQRAGIVLPGHLHISWGWQLLSSLW